MVLRRWLAGMAAMGLGAAACAQELDADHTGWPDTAGSNPVSRVFIHWGDTNFIVGDEYFLPGPVWWLGAFKDGGEWQTNPPAWHVAASEVSDFGNLYLLLDRAWLTNDLAMAACLAGSPDAELFVDLIDTNGATVVSGGADNLLDDITTDSWAVVTIPLQANPSAAGLRLRRDAGELVVYETLLWTVPAGTVLNASTNPGSMGAEVGAPGFPTDIPGTSASGLDGQGVGGSLTNSPGMDGGSSTNNPGGGNDGGSAGGGNDDGQDRADESGVIYVDQAKGNDTFTGHAPHISAKKGPKKTIHGGLSIASTSDVIVIKTGHYHENLNIQGKNVKVVIEGNVRL